MPEIKFSNSLTGKKETFKPVKKSHVGIYSCGPTVYSEQHIGNLRTALLTDLIIRVLKYNKYKIKHIINYTDVGHLTSDRDEGEDKVERAAKKENLSVKEITQKYINLYEKDLEKLNIQFGKRVRATEHIKEQIELIKKLEKKGYTYKTSDGIYFDTSKFKSYGQLAGFGKIERKAGARISLGEKKNSSDFALWKFSQEGEKRLQEWDSPWGIGFPGWHIECSAMSMKYLGETFDIHTGGQDLSQVHHNNEIAQSECATGKKFVNYWIHGGFLSIGGEKASKSTGNIMTISELEEQGYSPMHYRYFALQTHYRKPLNFTLENLDSAKTAYERAKRKIIELKSQEHKGNDLTKEYEAKFIKAINDDLNLPEALQIFLKVVEDFDFEPKSKLKLLEKFDKVLGLKISEMQESLILPSPKVENYLKEREKLRQNKLWAEADIIRERIREEGYEIEDTEQGPKLSRI